jgi:PAS domain S-box-containing protein
MRRLRDLPLRQKLLLIIVVTSLVPLLLVAAGIFAYELTTVQERIEHELAELTAFVGANSAASLAFQDADAAQGILSTLAARPAIVAGAIYGEGGDLFASYLRADRRDALIPRRAPPPGRTLEAGQTEWTSPIVQKGLRLGTLYLRADAEVVHVRLTRYAGIVLVVMVALGGGAFLLFAMFRRLLSDPILGLAGVARRVSEEQNFSLRASKHSEDEIGLLTDTFNTMFARIQQREKELTEINLTLEERVATRTRELRETEEQFRASFEQAAVGMAQVAPDGRWLRVNQKLCDIVGYTREELLRLTFQDITHPSDLEADLEYVRQMLAGEIQSYDMEKRYLRRDRSIVWINLTVALTRQPSGAPKYFISVVEDITERKRAEHRLATQYAVTRILAEADTLATAAANGLQAIGESAGWDFGAIWIVDRPARLLRCQNVWHAPSANVDAFEQATRQRTFPCGTGLPGRVWASGKPAWIADVVKDSNFPRAPVAAAAGLHGAVAFPILLGGEILGVIEFFSREVREPENDLLEMFGAIGSQIGQFVERKRTREALAHERDLLQALMNNIPDNIYFKDAASRFTRINQAQARLLGVTDPRDAIGKTDFDYFEHAPEAFADEQRILQSGQPLIGKLERVRSGSGEYRWVSTTKVAIAGKDGRPVGLVGITRDVTELEAARKALERTAADLVRSNTELEQLAYAASHDLQEPLRMVVSYLQLIERRYKGKLGQEADEFIHFAVDGATRMQRLINDLLDYSRVGTRAKSFQPVNCAAVLKIVLANLKIAIEESGAKITHEPMPVVGGDEAQLTRVFQNLIANAIKYRGNGIGIDPQYVNRIFVIFQRLHPRDKYEGTGIGLAVCKRIVERHGGRIWVESKPGRGSTLFFSIPEQGETTHE